jgi:hypothetical protein
MAIRIVVSNTVRFKVKGVINDASGSPQPFDFSLTCRRLPAAELKERLQNAGDTDAADFLAEVIEDWSGVRGEDDQAVPYSVPALLALCQIPGLATVAFRAYLGEVGAKEKN